MYVNEYINEVWQRRRTIVYGTKYTIGTGVNSIRIGFGRASGSGVTLTQTDIDTYFRFVIYRRSLAASEFNALNVHKDYKRCAIKYISDSSSLSTNATEGLSVYIPSFTGYIRYFLEHFVNDTTEENYDVWRIYNARYSNNNIGTETSVLTAVGEWECALKLDGRDDFSGGSTHGDEIMSNATFLINGKPVDISTFTDTTEIDELILIRTSTLYDPSDHTTPIAEHGAKYVFNRDGIELSQTIKWLVEATLSSCYLTMFPASKSRFDRATENADFAILELPSDTSTPLETINKSMATSVTMWDTSTKFSADVEVFDYPTGLTGGDKAMIHDNSGGAYNKVYFVVCTGGTSAVNELWQAKAKINIEYTE